MKFKVGDYVIGNAKASEAYSMTRTGTKWYVTGFNGIYMSIVERMGDSRYVPYDVMPKYFDLVRPPILDLSKPVYTRSGVRVKVTRDKGPRPYKAVVEVSGKPLELSFDKSGQFCPHGPSPVDLVNDVKAS